jgi:hypothetical protein
LINQLKKHLGGSGHKEYYGNHHDPEDPETCLGEADPCDIHWHYPEIIDKKRKIVIPWGKPEIKRNPATNEVIYIEKRRAIPFVVCEGQLYFVDAQTGDDYDRTFRMIVNPAYKHITNPINPLEYCNQGQVDGEMCIWFMGEKLSNGNFSPSFTNIKRNQRSSDLADMFQLSTTNEFCRAYVYDKKNAFQFVDIDTCSKTPVRKESDCKITRTWMLGTWCADTSHGHGGDHFNEIHPAYWVVPFFGAWERFHLSQYYFMSDLIIRPDYFNRFKTDALLQNLGDFINALIGSDKKNYSKYVVHLHQYGLNLLQPEEKTAGIDILSSIKIETIDFWAQKQSIATLKTILKKKLQKVFDLLTNLGSGFLLYPGMFYCYEMAEIKKVNNIIDVKQYAKEALLKSDNFDNLSALKNDMINSYHICFDELYLRMQNNPSAIAEFYAKSSMRYITQGLFIRDFILDERANSINYEDHYNFALEKLNTGAVQPLTELMGKRVETFWWDALPFARET